MDRKLEMQSEMLKSLANPHRLAIVKTLMDNEFNATQLTEKVGISKANLSQHMDMLLINGLVTARKEKNNVFYKLSGKLVMKAFGIMEELAEENVKREQDSIKRAF